MTNLVSTAFKCLSVIHPCCIKAPYKMELPQLKFIWSHVNPISLLTENVLNEFPLKITCGCLSSSCSSMLIPFCCQRVYYLILFGVEQRTVERDLNQRPPDQRAQRSSNWAILAICWQSPFLLISLFGCHSLPFTQGSHPPMFMIQPGEQQMGDHLKGCNFS